MTDPIEPRPVVLVVDDDPLVIRLLAAILDEDCDIEFATSGAEALAAAPVTRPDLILLDVMMADMSGHAVCQALKSVPATADIPVIFVTGVNDPAAESIGLELGADDYITKPVNAAVVRARVRHQIRQRRTRAELDRLAATDGLTGLANRRRFDEVLNQESRRLSRSQGWLSLIMADVDLFKGYNDRFGHLAGDDCLRRIALTLAAVVGRAADMPARYGGEEFACLLPETEPEGARQVAERLRQAVLALAIPDPGAVDRGPGTARLVTLSLGVASQRCQGERSGLALLAAADAALYQAKAAGRNTVITAPLSD